MAFDYLGDIPVIWFPCGDIIDIPYNGRSHRYIAMDKPGARQVAHSIIEPIANRVKSIVPILGTPAHTDTDAEEELTIWRDYDNVIPDDETGQPGWWHFTGKVEEYKLDVAHFCTMGSKALSAANAANSLASDTMMDYALAGFKEPDLVVRAHVHRTADSGDNFPTRALILPGWQLPTIYGKTKKPTRPVDIGMVVMIIDNDQIVSEEKWIQRVPRLTPWSRQL